MAYGDFVTVMGSAIGVYCKKRKGDIMNEQTKFDMIIVGGGPGGYTAALYGARAGLSTLVLEKMAPGGQMTLTGAIDNYPGFPEGIDGFELGERMRQGAQRFGAQTRMTEVLALDLAPDVKRVETDQGTYFARTVVLATGAAPKRLGVPGEEELIGRGVSYCAHCDGMFYRGKTVAVVGGGNTAVAEALHLARICEKVILIHRRDQLRATKIYHRQLEAAPNVEIRWNSAVEALNQTDGALTGVALRDTVTGAQSTLSCDGLFVCVGTDPASALVRGQVALDERGYVVADETTRTDQPGVFAVGDLRTRPLRQVITAAADGATAAHFAQEYLNQS